MPDKPQNFAYDQYPMHHFTFRSAFKYEVLAEKYNMVLTRTAVIARYDPKKSDIHTIYEFMLDLR